MTSDRLDLAWWEADEFVLRFDGGGHSARAFVPAVTAMAAGLPARDARGAHQWTTGAGQLVAAACGWGAAGRRAPPLAGRGGAARHSVT